MSGGALFLVNGYNEEITPIIVNDVYGLYSDNDIVYIIMQNGDILRLAL